jgi:hypothetical protein
MRECIKKHAEEQFLLIQNSSVTSEWAGWLLQNATTPVVVGPLIPKAGSTFLRAMFGDINRPEALTSIPDFLKLRRDEKQHPSEVAKGEVPANRRFWFAVVRDPLSRLVDAYIQVGKWVVADEDSGCSFGKSDDAKYVLPGVGRKPQRWRQQRLGGDDDGDVVVAIELVVAVATVAAVPGCGGGGGGGGSDVHPQRLLAIRAQLSQFFRVSWSSVRSSRTSLPITCCCVLATRPTH